MAGNGIISAMFADTMDKTAIALTILLSAATAHPAPSAADTPPSATAAALQAFMRGDFRGGQRFVLEGVVASRIGNRGVIVEDATGRVLVYSIRPSIPKPGDKIVANGHAVISDAGYHFLKMDSFEKIGHVEPSKPIAATAEQIAGGEVDLHDVFTRGYVADVFLDEIDDRFYYFVLKSGRSNVYAALTAASIDDANANALRHAFVEVSGTVDANRDGGSSSARSWR